MSVCELVPYYFTLLMSLYNIKEIITISFYSSIWSEHGGFHIFAKDGAEDVHDFTKRGIGFDGCVISFTAHALKAFEMRAFPHPINVECRDFDVFFYDIVVYTNDRALVLVNLLLVAIGRLSNLTLEETVLDTGQHTTKCIDTIQVIHRRAFSFVSQTFDKVRTAQRLNCVNDATLTGNDLLSTQSNQHSTLSRESQSFIQGIGVQGISATQDSG